MLKKRHACNSTTKKKVPQSTYFQIGRQYGHRLAADDSGVGGVIFANMSEHTSQYGCYQCNHWIVSAPCSIEWFFLKYVLKATVYGRRQLFKALIFRFWASLKLHIFSLLLVVICICSFLCWSLVFTPF